MANQRIIDEKKKVVEEIAQNERITPYVFFEYRGLTVTETNELRRKLEKVIQNLRFIKTLYQNVL